jgi:serine/threonine protein kinase
MFRGIAYLHAKGICHRDIKSANILVDDSNLTLKLCDLGSAKQLVPDEPSINYI